MGAIISPRGPRLRRLHRVSPVFALALAVTLPFLAFVLPGNASEPPGEYDVKAAFLLNFTKFVEWPPQAFQDSASPVTICILGGDPFGRTIDELVSGEKLENRAVAVRRIRQVGDARGCQVLFIGTLQRAAAADLKQVPPGVLTVTESENAAAAGLINFVLDNRRVRFDINQTAAQAAGLKLSSQLLKVARSVK